MGGNKRPCDIFDLVSVCWVTTENLCMEAVGIGQESKRFCSKSKLCDLYGHGYIYKVVECLLSSQATVVGSNLEWNFRRRLPFSSKSDRMGASVRRWDNFDADPL